MDPEPRGARRPHTHEYRRPSDVSPPSAPALGGRGERLSDVMAGVGHVAAGLLRVRAAGGRVVGNEPQVGVASATSRRWAWPRQRAAGGRVVGNEPQVGVASATSRRWAWPRQRAAGGRGLGNEPRVGVASATSRGWAWPRQRAAGGRGLGNEPQVGVASATSRLQQPAVDFQSKQTQVLQRAPVPVPVPGNGSKQHAPNPPDQFSPPRHTARLHREAVRSHAHTRTHTRTHTHTHARTHAHTHAHTHTHTSTAVSQSYI
ncbi:hypothetical protein EYF80_056210 [Liparis tanakae]|uniref:Uncharacterized protein n=1 Tax=Liparis tanakae TaxID=230148 RepID=A0A4Z2EYG7_9TELE|nr:hypothetical protein EYF80_056210 [Liparis tanakae]